ncbi:MAG TPA: hypothetical protein IAB02_08855 [Candidatus Pullichristensenella excrementigallinarum]|uniref:Germination protein, Ger(X)C family n=1 Tax=Candidatus Pullichristensenella excrementigallinarum TaxID=2840907 RepID=A0A9D1LCH5_9FIRM|nr:hypothetical protein [Candidatus Pullichristensenella excrementigallinarum]
MRRIRKIVAFFLAALFCCLLTGCQSQSKQLESLALAILFGVDTDAEGAIELTVQIPKIGASSGMDADSGDEAQQSQASDYMIASAKGATYSDAMDLLRLTIPRDLSLRQVKMIIISEELASSDTFIEITQSIAETYQLYNAAEMIICMGSARDFIEEQKPIIGTRISTGVIAMLEHYQERGFIPTTSFADFLYSCVSVYSDSLAALAAQSEPGAEALPEGGVGDSLPSEIPAQSENRNEYMGCAVFRDGIMVDKLNGHETLFVNLLRGKNPPMNYTVDGDVAQLQFNSSPKIQIDVSRDSVEISIRVDMTAVALTVMPDIERLRSQFEQDMLSTFRHCQALGVDPFGFAEIAAGKFLTIDQWLEYDWHEKFPQAEFSLDIRIHKSDT